MPTPSYARICPNATAVAARIWFLSFRSSSQHRPGNAASQCEAILITVGWLPISRGAHAARKMTARIGERCRSARNEKWLTRAGAQPELGIISAIYSAYFPLDRFVMIGSPRSRRRRDPAATGSVKFGLGRPLFHLARKALDCVGVAESFYTPRGPRE